MKRTNRDYWNATSDGYQDAHGDSLSATALAWGVWRIPESELGILGAVKGVDILELGCGAAQWSIALDEVGAQVVGIDFSERQLKHARKSSEVIPLVQGSAESLPFNAESFDIVFCDHGATTFSPPELTVAEASRVLRPSGIFAFSMSSPIRDICWDANEDRVSSQLAADYFGLHAIEDGDQTCYQLPYGGWIRLFRQHALQVEDLVELRAPNNAETTYSDFVPRSWAERWPAENIWKLRKLAI